MLFCDLCAARLWPPANELVINYCFPSSGRTSPGRLPGRYELFVSNAHMVSVMKSNSIALNRLIALVVFSLALGSHSLHAADVISTGSLKGAGGHKSSGTVQIVKDGAKTKVVFAKNFWLDGAPDPRVAFGNGRYVRGTIIARLKRTRGRQEYTVPSHINLANYSQVWLWCKKFNSPIAVANLK